MSKQSSIRTQIGFLTHRISGKAFPVSERLAICIVRTLASYISLKGKLQSHYSLVIVWCLIFVTKATVLKEVVFALLKSVCFEVLMVTGNTNT